VGGFAGLVGAVVVTGGPADGLSDGPAAGGASSPVGKTRGVNVTPGGTACWVCHGAHVGAAASAGVATRAWGRGVPLAVGTAYVVVSTSPSATAPSVTPAAGVVHGRRRKGITGVIAGKD
jgi:hypothetical protein